jgi:hypothetical protein
VTVTQTGIPHSDAHGNDDMVRVVEEVRLLSLIAERQMGKILDRTLPAKTDASNLLVPALGYCMRARG